jgi:hypothetical protein
MVRAGIFTVSISPRLFIAIAGESPVGAAFQHEEGSRNCIVNGSTTRETMFDEVPAGTAKLNACGWVQSVLEVIPARHWQIDSLTGFQSSRCLRGRFI